MAKKKETKIRNTGMFPCKSQDGSHWHGNLEAKEACERFNSLERPFGSVIVPPRRINE